MTTENKPSDENLASQSTLSLLKSIFKPELKYWLTFKFLKEWKNIKALIKKRSWLHWLLTEVLEIIFFILPVVLIFRELIFQSSLIPSPSMYPTLKKGDRLIVSRFIYKLKDPERFDIVVFKSKEITQNKQYVKRLIGLPGDILEIKRGIVYINGEQIVFKGINIQRDFSSLNPIKIPEGHYFVMGDNRSNSLDSRYFGFLKRKDFIGQAWFTFWPPQQIGILH